jgi:hypothetical protein
MPIKSIPPFKITIWEPGGSLSSERSHANSAPNSRPKYDRRLRLSAANLFSGPEILPLIDMTGWVSS